MRTRNESIDIENLTPNIVDGTAHICFTKDKSWFQVLTHIYQEFNYFISKYRDIYR